MRTLAMKDLYYTDRVKVERAVSLAKAGGAAGVVVTDEGSWQVFDLDNDLGRARFNALTDRSPEFMVGVYRVSEDKCIDLAQMVIDDLILMGAV